MKKFFIIVMLVVIGVGSFQLLKSYRSGIETAKKPDPFFYSVVKYKYIDIMDIHTYAQEPLVEKIIKWDSKTLCHDHIQSLQGSLPKFKSAECLEGDGRYDAYFIDPKPGRDIFFVYSLKDRGLTGSSEIQKKHDYEKMIAKLVILRLALLALKEDDIRDHLAYLAKKDIVIDPKGLSGKRELIVDFRAFIPGKEIFLSEHDLGFDIPRYTKTIMEEVDEIF